mmetsp:Transcript_8487/g.17622  ORF Transcript_8487/g.17622 Transcript_8487/m.17622 type:complete len:113 (+) Transcript_8487:1269-1607(+)
MPPPTIATLKQSGTIAPFINTMKFINTRQPWHHPLLLFVIIMAKLLPYWGGLKSRGRGCDVRKHRVVPLHKTDNSSNHSQTVLDKRATACQQTMTKRGAGSGSSPDRSGRAY